MGGDLLDVDDKTCPFSLTRSLEVYAACRFSRVHHLTVHQITF